MAFKKIHLLYGAIGVSLLLLLFTIVFHVSREPIKVGLIVSLTGSYPDLGREIRDGALLAVEVINERGGIKGRTLELLVRDNKYNTATALSNIDELINQGVVAIIGPGTSTMALNLLPTINQKKITLIAPTPTSTVLAGLDDYLIRMRPTNMDEAKAIADFIRGKLKSKRIVILYDPLNPTYSVDLIENLNRLIGNSAVIFTHSVLGKTSNLRMLSEKILTYKPDLVLLVVDVYKTSKIIQHLRMLNCEVPIFISIWAKSPKIIEFAGKRAEGVYTVDNIEFPLRGEEGEYIRERFKKRYGRDMDLASINGYDSVMVLKRALEEGASAANMKDVILKIGKFNGIQGEITFDRFGDRVEKPFVLRIEKGKYVRVEQ